MACLDLAPERSGEMVALTKRRPRPSASPESP